MTTPRLISDLKSSIEARIPLMIGNRLLTKQAIDDLLSDGSESDEVGENGTSGSGNHLKPALVEIRSTLGSSVPLLDAMARRPKWQTKLKSVFGRIKFFLVALFFMATAGLVFVRFWLWPAIQILNHDMRTKMLRAEPLPWFGVIEYGLLAFIAISFTLLLFVLFSSSLKLADLLGGKKYRRAESDTTAFELAALVAARGVEPARAVKLAGQVVADNESELHQIEAKISADETVDSLFDKFLFSSLQARSQLVYLQKTVPVILVLFLGGTFSLIYAVSVYLPIVSIFSSSRPGG